MRRIAFVLAVLVTTPGALFMTPPASADIGVCLFDGTLTLSGSLHPLVSGKKSTVGFTFTFVTVEDCGPLSSKPFGFSAAGSLTGYCDNFWGSGMTNNHHRFIVMALGPILVFSGELVGAATIVQDVTTNQSCANPMGPGTNRFVVAGSVLKCHDGPRDVTVTGKPLDPAEVQVGIGSLCGAP